MQDSMLLKKKVASGDPNLVLAMDFDTGSFKDLVLGTRTFSVAGGGGGITQSVTQAKNGTQSLYQSQVAAGGSVYLTTPLSSDLTFTGDFWMEAWGYCLGQGNTLYTGGYNTLLSYGSYSATGGLWR